jgi:TolB protein
LGGRFIAFTSDRSGSWEIWKSDSDGANPQQITNFAGGMVVSPNWSLDGRTIIFDARSTGRSNIYTVPATGGSPKSTSANNFEDKPPSFFHDGKWIYFGSGRNGSVQQLRMPAQGWPSVLGDFYRLSRSIRVARRSPDL